MTRAMHAPRPGRAPALLLRVLLAVLTGGCAGTVVAPSPDEVPERRRGVPGFDTRDYPGDAVMEAWRDAAPYQWVGYYLAAPCYTGSSWEGKRLPLRSMGWGIAVLFVGEQDWAASSAARAAALEGPEAVSAGRDSVRVEPADSAAEAAIRCTRDNLSEQRGLDDGVAAAEAAAREGFGAGVVVYLDVERVEAVSERLAAYVAGWTRGLMDGGYSPGLYAHARNAEALLAVMAEAAGDAVPEPRLWVASPVGFSLRRGPTESGFPATIWQGELDARETWAGTTLRIDRNVADRPDPSR